LVRRKALLRANRKASARKIAAALGITQRAVEKLIAVAEIVLRTFWPV
jgi:biotin operon repressor